MFKASNLTHPAFTRVEKENCQAMAIYRNYEKYLKWAKENKADYLKCKEWQKVKTSESLDRLVIMFKENAIEYWEKSQKYLAEYNEFEKNRKYPNK